MTSSRSKTSKSKLAGARWSCSLVAWASRTPAARKRIVVLDFEGPKAEKFHDDVVKLLKKTTTRSSRPRSGTARPRSSTPARSPRRTSRRSRRSSRSTASSCGKIEKDGDEYTLKLKLRAGKSGEIVGDEIEIKADGPSSTGKARRKVKEGLLPGVDRLEEVGKDKDEPETKTPTEE